RVPRSRSPPPLVNQGRNQCSPPRLVRRSHPTALVAVKALVEEQAIPPVRVFLKGAQVPVHGPSLAVIPGKDADQPPRDVPRHFLQRDPFPAAPRNLHPEGRA